MAQNVDLTSKEWRDIVFENKNKEFGAYELRQKSDRRHNLAVLYSMIGLLVIIVLIIALSLWSKYKAEQRALEIQEERERMEAMAEMAEDDTQDEEEEIDQKVELEMPTVPEEVLATVQVTQIAIVDADKVKNEVMDMESQKEDNTARGVVNQEGSDDVDRLKAVQEQVVVKEEVVQKHEPEKIFQAVEQPAEFPGGQAAMMKWLSNNIRYPESAQQNGVSGRVTVKFVVEKDGSISNVTVLKGVDRDLDQEAVRVVKRMPKWQAGKNNGQAVRSYFNLPVTFKLANQ